MGRVLKNKQKGDKFMQKKKMLIALSLAIFIVGLTACSSNVQQGGADVSVRKNSDISEDNSITKNSNQEYHKIMGVDPVGVEISNNSYEYKFTINVDGQMRQAYWRADEMRVPEGVETLDDFVNYEVLVKPSMMYSNKIYDIRKIEQK